MSTSRLSSKEVKEKISRRELTLAALGCGAMGLPSACLFAEAGFRVMAVDSNPAVVEALREARAPLAEPGVEALLRKHVRSSSLIPTLNAVEAVHESDAINVLVPTPLDELGRPDYGPLLKASESIGRGLRAGSLIIVSSTVGPGVTEEIVKATVERLSGLKAGGDFGLAFSPIRASPGSVLRDLASYPRVLGAVDERSLEAATTVLSTVAKPGVVKVKDLKTAEAVKLFENVYRFVSLSLSNELAVLCEKMGIDYVEARNAAVTQPHCHLLMPGIGVGGHLPKDIRLLTSVADEYRCSLRVLEAASKANEALVRHSVNLIAEAIRASGRGLRRSRIAFLGVSYKANVKEARGSRSLDVIRALERRGARVQVYDPYFSPQELQALGLSAARTLEASFKDANCVVFSVAHDAFRKLDLRALRALAHRTVALVDFGRAVDFQEAVRKGFSYRGVGKET